MNNNISSYDSATSSKEVAEELQYIIIESIPDISDKNLVFIISIGEKVFEASWHLSNVFGEDREVHDKRGLIDKTYLEAGIKEALENDDQELVDCLKNPNIPFYLSSCRVVAYGFSKEEKNALEKVKNSVRRLN